MSPEVSTAAGDATGRSSPCPDPAANDQNVDLRSDAQPSHATTGISHAVDLQLRSSPAMANTRKSLTESGKQPGFNSKQQVTSPEPLHFEQAAVFHGEAPSMPQPRPPPSGQLGWPTRGPHSSILNGTQPTCLPTTSENITPISAPLPNWLTPMKVQR